MERALDKFLTIPWYELSVDECQRRAIDLMVNYWDFQNKVPGYIEIVLRMRTQNEIKQFMFNSIKKGILIKAEMAARGQLCESY